MNYDEGSLELPMSDFVCPRLSLSLRLLGVAVFLSALLFVPNVPAQIIYENATRYLNTTVNERREYGDQLDLGGTSRRLTDLRFEYFGRFVTGGDEAVKVRLYTNEKPYDNFRKAPTTLLYESGWKPISPGFHTHLITGLDVLLPPHTVTFTVEFAGLAEDEEAGLLFYDPPTTGYSFNEFWVRGATGLWFPVNYSTTDPNQRANVGLQLIAVPEVVLDQQQTNAVATLPMRDETNRVRFAQTFTADVTGILSRLVLAIDFTNAPVRLRILDTIDGRPGPNVLAARNILRTTGLGQNLSMLASAFSVQKGKQYAIELSTAAGVSETPSYLLALGTNNYAGGSLWVRNEDGGLWTETTDAASGGHNLDAVFQVHVTPAVHSAEITMPRPFESFDLSEPILIRAQHKPPEIGTITRMRFLDGTRELGVVTNAPYEFVWTNATTGEHNLRAIAEDSFRRPFRSDFTTINVRPAGAPENDLFARRIALDGTTLRRIKPSAEATVETNEPGGRTNHPAGATLWWAWTAYDASPVTISAQNSSSNGASVAVFKGSNLETLTAVTNGVPLARFVPEPGVTYALSVDPASRGDQVVLDLVTADIRVVSVSTNVLRANDPLIVTLTGSASRTITNVHLLFETELFGISRTAPARLTNIVSTNGYFDLVAVAVDDRGIETVSAPFRVTVRPRNDAFAERGTLAGDQFRQVFLPGAGSIEAGEPLVADVGYAERGSIWWTWTAPATGKVRLQIVSGGSASAIAVFTGNALEELVLVQQNAGTGVIHFEAEAGRAYQFRVIGNSNDIAPLELSLFMDVVRIVEVDFSDAGVTLSLSGVDGRAVGIEYSSDLLTWQRAGGAIIENGEESTWTDSGPPATVLAPREERLRFYRVVIE